MKTLTALFLWVLSSFGGPPPPCEGSLPEDDALCQTSTVEEAGEAASERGAEAGGRRARQENVSRISNGF